MDILTYMLCYNKIKVIIQYGGFRMNSLYNYVYTEEEFEDIQKKFDGKAEFDNGSIFLSSNTSIRHNEIKSNILASLIMFLKGHRCKAYDEQIEVVFRNDTELYKYKPDIFVMCEDATKNGESFTSSPKVIFEVVSKSTASHDYITKLAVYQKFRVLEYNIVEQSGHIIQYSIEDSTYLIKSTFKGNDTFTSSVFPDLEIKLEDIF